MKTHIPTSLRKALLAALFATVSIASTTYAVEDVTNVSRGFAETTLGSNKYSKGYTDLTFSGTDSVLGTVDHWCHDYNTIALPSHFIDREGDDTEITLAPDERSGKFIAHSVTSSQGKDSDTDFDLDDWHNHDSHDEYGYSYSWSNGNIYVNSEAVLEVTTDISAHGTLGITGSSQVTAGNKVSAGEIKVTSGQLTAKDISVTVKNLWNPGDDDYDSTGELLVRGSAANVTATGTVYAEGGVNVSKKAHLNANTITSNVTGSGGYVRALPNQNLTITGAIASEGTQYIVDNGYTITLGGIGLLVNEGTEDEPEMVMYGNGNYFGYGEDSNNIKADAIYVMGDIISDNNSLAALGSAVDDQTVDSSCNTILVNGSITGNDNSLFVRSQDAAGIWVDKNISGDHNELTINDGDIHVGGTLGRTKDGDNGAVGNRLAAGDDITIHQFSDNENLSIDAWNGEVTVEKASEATLLNSHITAADDVVIARDETGSTKELKLVASDVTSEDGDIVSHQVISANGTALTAEEGDINVYSLTYDPENTKNTGIQVTAQNLISEEDLKLNGKKTGSFNSFVDVTEDMRTTKGSISITNFTDKDTVKVGQDIESADSISIKNVNGMLVGTEDEGEIQYEGSMTAQKDIEIADSIVDILGSQGATSGKISITKEGSETRVTIDGNQTAGTTITAQGATLHVGTLVEEEGADGKPVYSVEGGKQVAGGDISIINSLVEVLDSMESTDGKIQIKDGTVTVGATDPSGVVVQAGDMTAKNDISMDHSMVNVLGGQKSSEGSISVTNGSEVYVNEDQQAHGSISVTGSELYVGGSQVTETGGIQVSKGAYVAVLEDQQAAGDITIDDSSIVEVLGSQTSTNGAITMSNGSEVHVDGDQQASGTIKVDNADVYIGGTQKSDTGNIVIRDNAHESVFGDQTAETGSIIVAKDSTLTVGAKDEDGNVISQGDQWAAQNIKIVAGSAVEVIGDQTARDEDIIVKGSTLTVGAIQENAPLVPGWPSTYELIGGNQTAGGNIVLVNDKNVDVLGDQDAGASIIVKKTTLTVGSKADDGKVVHAGDQTAGGNIVIVKDSDVAILGNEMAGGDIVVKDSTLKVGELEHISIMPWPAFDWLHGGDQTANGNIFISNADVDVLRNQQAVTGAISIQKGSEVTIGSEDSDGNVLGGDQTAQTNINIANSTVHVLGDEEAVTGEIVIAKTDLEGADTIVNVDGDQTAQTNIIVRDADVTVLGNQTATKGYIDISSTSDTGITSTVNVGGDQEAGDYINVTNSLLTVGTVETITDETTGEEHVVLTGGNQTADKGDITISNSTVTVRADQKALEGGIKIDKLSLVTIGTVDVDGTVLAGDQLAKEDIRIDSSTLMVMDNQTSQEGSISVQALDDFSLVMVGGSQTAKKHIGIFGSKEHEKPTTVLVGEDQIAGEGNIAINDAQVAVKGKVVALGDGSDSTGIVTLAGATYDVGVSLEAKELNIGTIDNPSTVTINVASLDADGETPLPTVLDVDKLVVDKGNTLHTGNVKMDAADVTIHGVVEAGVKDYSDPTKDIAADWKVTGSHDISGANAHLMANGDIEIVAAEEGDTIRIAEGAKVSATGDVTIQGLAAVLAEVDGATVRATGDITLDNAELKNNTETDITTKGSDIVLKNRVEISDTILNVLPPEEGDEGVINVTEDADVQLYRGTVNVFNGKLAGTGTVTANEENLELSHDSTAFNGTINMVRDNEQTLYISDKGVGEDATINLQEGSSLGTLVGGQDAHLGNVYSSDGSHIQMNAVDKGNRTTATSLNLTSGTTYELFASTDDTTGALLADTITVSDGINANGARVRAHSDAQLETLADGSRFTIAGGTVESAFNEDVLYDMSGPQRQLQTRNMHLEHNAKGVDLVVSENYKGIDYSNANVNAVREIILPLDAAADHRPGRLAQSDSNLDHILDALDYTRSGADAKAGLLSVSAAANLIVPNMMMDASRHHLSTLRDHMNAPVCTKDTQSKGNVWAAYTGGHDFIGSDDNMGKYTHSYNGAIIGGDYAVNCNWAIGLSVGYQNSIARTDATRADADIISGDLYVVGRTGKFTHRFSMGLSAYNTDVKRGTRIAAKGHGYDELSTGDADGMSWNFGYQLSRSYAINEVSAITPYLAVDVALQRIDTMTEKGQGDASVVTDYEDFVQTDAALGVSYSHTFASFNQQRGMFAFDLAVHGEFSEHRATAQNHFVDSPADTWKTRSAKRAPLYGELGGHVQVPFTEHFSGTAGVNFEFSDDRTYIGGHAGVNYRF